VGRGPWAVGRGPWAGRMVSEAVASGARESEGGSPRAGRPPGAPIGDVPAVIPSRPQGGVGIGLNVAALSHAEARHTVMLSAAKHLGGGVLTGDGLRTSILNRGARSVPHQP
jgi:hypothetical protein